MTGPHDDTPQRRDTDHGHLGGIRIWWRQWGQLIIGVTVLGLAVATFVIGLEVRGFSKDRAQDAETVRVIAQAQAKNAKETAAAARSGCLRARVLGPSLIQDYQDRGVLTPAQLALYRSLIPKTCPK